MATPQLNLELEEGADYNLQISYVDPITGLPIDITNYHAVINIDAKIGDAGSIITLTTEDGRITINGVNGVITVGIPAATSTGFGLFLGFYNLYIYPIAGSQKIKLCKGFFTVSPSVLG